MSVKTRQRRFLLNECIHIYQRTINGFMLFYDREDFLVCFMVLSTTAKKYRIKVFEVCFMPDHLHLLIEADSREVMSSFMRDFFSVFVHEYNMSIGRKGQLLHKSYGSAPKKGEKKTRAAIVYVGNNPVEKKLCVYAEDYRWNFLKYLVDANPFSSKIPLSRCSRHLRRCISVVKSASESGIYLNYFRLRQMLDRLSGNELEYLTDFIISSYSPFYDSGIMDYYKNWEQMIAAMHSTTGSEHDIKEVIHQGSDQVFRDMVRYILKEKGLKPVRQVTVLTFEQKLQLASELSMHTGASSYEIKKFLHLR